MEFWDWLRTLGAPWHMVIIVVFLTTVAGLIGSLAKQIRKYACHRRETELKSDLVARGLSVDEIERVVAAKSHYVSDNKN